MQKHKKLTQNLFVIGMMLALSQAVVAQTSTVQLKVKPSTIYHVVQGKPLAAALEQLAQRSGIVFKINTDLGADVVSQSIAADNWQMAIRSLLAGYNFILVEDGDIIKTVIISGHNNDATNVVTALTRSEKSNQLTISAKAKALPKKYHDFPAGSVMAINLPVKELLAMHDNASISVDLPIGQYNLAHSRTVKEADGSKTWVGYLADQGEGYRVFLSKGAGGTMGVLTTPDGTYNIESDKTGSYLVDTGKLVHAGFQGDAVISSEIAMNAVTVKSAELQVTQLQATVNTAKIKLDVAIAAATQLTSILANYKTAYTTALAALDAATKKLNATKALYNNALATYKKKNNPENAAKAKAAASTLSSETAKYNAAVRAFNAVVNNVNTTNKALAAKTSEANIAKTAYDSSVKALNSAKTAVVTVSTTPPPVANTSVDTPVIDVMVVYTTVGYTADYAKQRIALLTTASNQAYADSGINLKLRVVYTEPTSYVEKNSNSQALDDVAHDRGVFAGIAAKRAQYGADLVFLFRPLYAQSSNSCGTTYLEFENGRAADKSTGYGVISDGSSKDAASSTYCGINTYTHEIGHSLGLVHDREYSQSTGVFPYAYAWGVSGKFATIMSYKQPVLMYFSTPTLPTQCAGQPCGYAASDATRSSDQTSSVNYTAPIVANFMPTLVSTPVLK